jgi:Alpha/beta hydrolase domain
MRIAKRAAVPLALAFGAAAAARADVPNPTVTGPIAATASPGDPSHAYPFFATNHDLAGAGYVEEEFFFSGTANRYSTPALATGTVLDGGHPYTTRMVVRRPADPKRFNGTVLVEWYNVTNGFDAENSWFFSWEHILRAGYVWVGVSAQRVGVNELRNWGPARYGALDVTQGGTINNDALCYDAYSQAGQALKHPGAVDPLHGLVPRLVLSIGESQSASRLVTYANSIHPLADVYDGFLLLSSLGGKIRSDLSTPVWKVSTEYDVAQSEALARQPDTDTFRAWEVAGTSHVDQHLRASREPLELRDRGVSSEAALAPTCQVHTIGTRVPTTYVLAAALDDLVRWASTGAPPPSAPAMATTSGAPAPGATVALARNSLGLALGGIQLSQLAVPTELNSGLNIGPGACVRWGYSTPFDAPTLAQLYRNHGDYVSKVTHVTDGNVSAGYMLRVDAQATIDEAAQSEFGKR